MAFAAKSRQSEAHVHGCWSKDYLEAWSLGKEAALKGLGSALCPYPTGTSKNSAYWLGYAEAIAEI